jgi:Zn finger protein HypA/HybF involved in hydrogenase expression
MIKELAEQLNKEVKERVPGVDLKVGQVVTITIATLQVMEKHIRSNGRFNRAKFLNTAANITEELLKEVPGGTE